jgi:excisionase family DNA binding protein
MKYTVEQVAVLMNVTRETVREWLIHGKLKGVKSGRIWVINKEDIKRPEQIKRIPPSAKGTYKDITGNRFGKLTVLSFVKTTKHGSKWLCKCDCGTEKIIDGHCMRKGKIISCGCMRDNTEELLKNIIDNTNIGRIQNETIPRNNTSGHRGVYYDSKHERWRVYIGFQKRKIWIGSFTNKVDAIKARKEAEEKYWKPFLEQHLKAGD